MAKVLEISFSYPKSILLMTIDAYCSPLNSDYTIPKIKYCGMKYPKCDRTTLNSTFLPKSNMLITSDS